MAGSGHIMIILLTWARQMRLQLANLMYRPTVILANDLREEGFTIVSLHPGFTNTSMGQNVKKSTDGIRIPTRSPQEAVGEMMTLTLGLTTKDNGRYMLHDGTDMPW